MSIAVDPLVNRFKHRLAAGDVQVGMWTSFAHPVAAEIVAGAGFDWLLIDAEHAPNPPATVLTQLQAAQGSPTAVIVRPPNAAAGELQPLADVGVTTFLLPMIETPEQAADAVAALRYPPRGRRGVATTRASRWGRVPDYWQRADAEMCVIAQIETVAGLAALEAIAGVDGVDAVFLGPSDLSAALGRLGEPNHPDVQTVVSDAIRQARAAGAAVGVFATATETAGRYADAGATMIAAGVDTTLLAMATAQLADNYAPLRRRRPDTPASESQPSEVH